MRRRAEDVFIDQIDSVLAKGFPWLAFPPALEARFEEDTGRARCRYLIICGVVALLLFNLVLMRDYQLIGDVFSQALVVRTGIATPLGLVIIAVWSRNPRPWLREGMAALFMILVVAAMLYLVVASRSPLAVHAQYPLLTVIIFFTIIQRVRFWYACAASAISLALCTIAIPQIEGMQSAIASSAGFTLVTITILTLVGNYSLEHEWRYTYLTGLRERLRSGELAVANQELNAISNRDPLTSLANRRHLERFLEALWAGGTTRARPVAVLMFDIDYFKRFNDHYGHLAGDKCLQTVSAILAGYSRAGDDLVARFGGEEFVVILPGADLENAAQIAERIRSSVESRAMPHLAAPARLVTVSAGVAAVRPQETAGYNSLLEMADAALYKAKGRGRNCVSPSPVDPATIEISADVQAEAPSKIA
jgi:diguanylate cyclase (GGDEF)-like protein